MADTDYTMAIVGNTNYYTALDAVTDVGNKESDSLEKVNVNSMSWVSAQRKSIHSMRMMLSIGMMSFMQLGVVTDQNSQAMMLMRDTAAVMMLAMAAYSAKQFYIRAQIMYWETVQAAEEAVIAGTIPARWPALAAAGVAAALVLTTFVATSVTSNADVSTPQGRRSAQLTVGGVSSGR